MLAALALIGTSFSVSLDTVLVGMNLAYKKAHYGKMVYMSFLTALVCFAFAITATSLRWDYQMLVGSALIVALGIYNLLSFRASANDTSGKIFGNTKLPTLTALSLILSIDNASTAAMMVLVGYNAWLTTAVFGGVTLVLLFFGALCSKVVNVNVCKRIFCLSGVFLIILGTYKFFAFFGVF